MTRTGADRSALPRQVASALSALCAHHDPGVSQPSPSEVGGARTAEGGPFLVALSGGRDSLVLLHLLRFGAGGGPLVPKRGIAALHVDHGMRTGSREDAAWVRGVCRAWQVPLATVRLDSPPRSEGRARALRYEAILGAAREAGAATVLVAHHAGDQAETVLFRILRGTGPRGLAGIPAARSLGPPGSGVRLVRPLLGIDPSALAAWAKGHGLRPREDPTNRDLRHERNRLRHEVLPALEAASPGTAGVLLRLSAEARRRERVLEEILEGILDRVLLEPLVPGRSGWLPRVPVLVARPTLLAYADPLLSEFVRFLARRGGVRVSRRGVALTLGFLRSAGSGRSVTPAPGFRVARDFDRFAVSFGEGHREEASPRVGMGDAGAVLRIAGTAKAGDGEVRTAGGGIWRVRWQAQAPGGSGARGHWTARFPLERLRFPLTVRGRREGDRVRVSLEGGTGPGSRALKKLLGERRVSREAREKLPLLLDADGLVIWIPGVWRSRSAEPGEGVSTWTVGVTDARGDEHEHG